MRMVVVRMRVSMAGVIMIVTAVTMRVCLSVSVTGVAVSMSKRVAMHRLLRRAIFPPCADQRAPLDPEQPGAERGNQPVADNLDPPDGAVHGAAGGAKQNRGDTHDRDRDQRLQDRRGKREHDAAPPGLAVGDNV